MLPSNGFFMLAFALVVGVALFIAAIGRTRRIQSERPRDVPLGKRKETEDELRHLLECGKKIEAIKSYRELYQVSLKEAKDAVELLEKQTA